MMNFKINGVYTKEAFNPPGKLLAYTLLERILKRTNNYCDPTSMSNSYIASQKYFFQKRACMYVTGDWLEREMETATEYRSEMIMVKPPVISDLSLKLEEEYSVSLGATVAAKDQKLAEIIKAVDEGKTSLDGVDQRVFDAVKEARSIVYSLANNLIGLMPKSSVNKDIAIDFLRFMYSDEGIEIMLRESKGNLPVIGLEKFDVGEVSTFRSSVNDLVRSNIQYIFSSGRDPIRYRAGPNEYMGNEKPGIAFGKKTGALTALEQLQKELDILNQNWSRLLRQSRANRPDG